MVPQSGLADLPIGYKRCGKWKIEFRFRFNDGIGVSEGIMKSNDLSFIKHLINNLVKEKSN